MGKSDPRDMQRVAELAELRGNQFRALAADFNEMIEGFTAFGFPQIAERHRQVQILLTRAAQVEDTLAAEALAMDDREEDQHDRSGTS